MCSLVPTEIVRSSVGRTSVTSNFVEVSGTNLLYENLNAGLRLLKGVETIFGTQVLIVRCWRAAMAQCSG